MAVAYQVVRGYHIFIVGGKRRREHVFEKLIRRDDTRLEVPAGYKQGMLVKGTIYVDRFLEKELESSAIEQVANVATLPGIVNASIAMPDIHTGGWRPT